MPEAIKSYVHTVDAFNRLVGLFAMYLIFAMLAVEHELLQKPQVLAPASAGTLHQAH